MNHPFTPTFPTSTASVISADGTRITYRSLGEGEPLVVAPGGGAPAELYLPLAERLASTYRVVLLDRRGYGLSEPGPSPASFLQDGADIQAVLEAVGEPSYLFGHSAGALAALHGARIQPRRIRRLALYEPPLTFAPNARPLLERFRRLRAEGNDLEALVAFMAATEAVPEEEARGLLPTSEAAEVPAIRSRLSALAVGIEHDVEAVAGLSSDPGEWSDLTLPVLLLAGSESQEHPLRDSVRLLEKALPDARVAILQGQEHIAHVLAPDLLAGALREFFVE